MSTFRSGNPLEAKKSRRACRRFRAAVRALLLMNHAGKSKCSDTFEGKGGRRSEAQGVAPDGGAGERGGGGTTPGVARHAGEHLSRAEGTGEWAGAAERVTASAATRIEDAVVLGEGGEEGEECGRNEWEEVCRRAGIEDVPHDVLLDIVARMTYPVSAWVSEEEYRDASND